MHPEIDVDTCHGALLFHKDLTEALPVLTQYDLVVIDELSMLTADHYDRVHAYVAHCREAAMCRHDWRFLSAARPSATTIEDM